MADIHPFQPSAPTEPSADLRQLASTCRQMYVALCNEGFTQREALTILGGVLSASIIASQGGGQE